MVPGVQIVIQSPSPPNAPAVPIQSPSPPNAPAVPGAQPMCTRCTRPSVFPPISTTLVYYFFRFKYSQKKDRGGVWETTVYYFILFVSVPRAQIAADPAPAADPPPLHGLSSPPHDLRSPPPLLPGDGGSSEHLAWPRCRLPAGRASGSAGGSPIVGDRVGVMERRRHLIHDALLWPRAAN